MDQYLALDTETTGLDPEHNDIIELAAIALDSQLEPREGVPHYHTLIRPQDHHTITDKAIEVNNHRWVYDKESEEWARALPYDQAWEHFFAWVKEHYAKPEWIILVGWNPSFDEQFLRYLHAHPDLPRTADGSAYVRNKWPFHYHKLDGISICRYLDLRAGRTRRSYKLEAMAEYYYGSFSKFAMHTALGDVDLTLKIIKQVEKADVRK